jgi:Flp pilus assembly protein TadD
MKEGPDNPLTALFRQLNPSNELEDRQMNAAWVQASLEEGGPSQMPPTLPASAAAGIPPEFARTMGLNSQIDAHQSLHNQSNANAMHRQMGANWAGEFQETTPTLAWDREFALSVAFDAALSSSRPLPAHPHPPPFISDSHHTVTADGQQEQAKKEPDSNKAKGKARADSPGRLEENGKNEKNEKNEPLVVDRNMRNMSHSVDNNNIDSGSLNPNPLVASFESAWQDVSQSSQYPYRSTIMSATNWEAFLPDVSSFSSTSPSSFLQGFESAFREAAMEGSHHFDGGPIYPSEATTLHPLTETEIEADRSQLQLHDAFSIGRQALAHGQAVHAVRWLEHAVRENSGDAEAWHLLGLAQQEIDRDDLAVIALSRAARMDPDNAGTWLELAVSYTNDGRRKDALTSLQHWLHLVRVQQQQQHQHQPASASAPVEEGVAEQLSISALQERMQSFLHSLAHSENQTSATSLPSSSSSSSSSDASNLRSCRVSCYVALGVLCNLAGDFERAVTFFSEATLLEEGNYMIWNKLGATLANGDRAVEAIPHYLRALRLKPSYIRTSVNLGIAYLKQRQYEQAARNFLAAMSLQEEIASAGGGDGSTRRTRDMLCTCFYSMGRGDLAELSNREDSTAAMVNLAWDVKKE